MLTLRRQRTVGLPDRLDVQRFRQKEKNQGCLQTFGTKHEKAELLPTYLGKHFKEPIRKVKIESTGWEKIFTIHISNKGPVPRIFKELSQLNNKTA